MRGDDLLLAHLALLDPPAGDEDRPGISERLETELGPELAAALVAALTRR